MLIFLSLFGVFVYEDEEEVVCDSIKKLFMDREERRKHDSDTM